MPRIEINTPAPKFIIADFQGQIINISDYRGKQNVLLVFNRGFL